MTIRAALLTLLWSTTALANEAATVLFVSGPTRQLNFAQGDILELHLSESGGQAEVFVRLGEPARDALADLTRLSVGQVIDIGFCDHIFTSPVVHAPIDSGTFVITGTTVQRAEALRALWHGRTGCDELAPELFELEAR